MLHVVQISPLIGGGRDIQDNSEALSYCRDSISHIGLSKDCTMVSNNAFPPLLEAWNIFLELIVRVVKSKAADLSQTQDHVDLSSFELGTKSAPRKSPSNTLHGSDALPEIVFYPTKIYLSTIK